MTDEQPEQPEREPEPPAPFHIVYVLAPTPHRASGYSSADDEYAAREQIALFTLAPDEVFTMPPWVLHGVQTKGWEVFRMAPPRSMLHRDTVERVPGPTDEPQDQGAMLRWSEEQGCWEVIS